MKRILQLCCLLVVIALSSCTTTYQASKEYDYKQAFVGQTHSWLVQQLGAPDRETSDGDGGRILIYEDYSQTTSGVQANYGYFSVPTSTTTLHTKYVQFFIDKYGKCYDVKTNHIKKWKEFSVGKTILLLGATVVTLFLLGSE